MPYIGSYPSPSPLTPPPPLPHERSPLYCAKCIVRGHSLRTVCQKTVTTKWKVFKRSWMSTNIALLNAAQTTLKRQIISLVSVRGISYIAEKWCRVHSLDSITAVKNSILVMFCFQHFNASPNIHWYFRRMKCDCFHGWRKNVNWQSWRTLFPSPCLKNDDKTSLTTQLQ